MPPLNQDLSSSLYPQRGQQTPTTPTPSAPPTPPVLPAQPYIPPSVPPVTPPPKPPSPPSSPAPRSSGGGNGKKLLVVVIVILLLGGGVAYAYTQGLLSFGGAPYATENLASNIVAGLSKIKTSSYSLNLSIFSEPKAADAVPFSVAVPVNAVKDEAYKRDVDRARDMNTVLSFVMNSYYKTKLYPSTLDEKTSAVAKNITYTPTADLKDFTLVATFETSDAIDTFTKMSKTYGDAVKVSGKTVTLKRDAGSYVYLPSTPPQPFLVSIFGLQSYISMIPGNMKLDGTLSGASQKTNDNKINSKVHLGGTVDLGDVNIGLDAEFRKVASTYYIVINKFPSVGVDLTKIKGKWIKVTEQDALTYGGGYFGGTANTSEDAVAKAKAEVGEQLGVFLSVADKDKVLIADGAPKPDKLNGVSTYRYELQFNKAVFAKFYQDLVEAFKNKYPDKQILVFDQATLDYLQSPEFDQAFEYFRKNTTLTLWADSDGIPLQLRYSLRMVPENKNGTPADRQVKFTFTLSLTDINKNISIEAPADAMTVEDATIIMTGQTKEEYRLQKQSSVISNLRYSISQYKSLAGKYPTTLDDLKKKRKDIGAMNTIGTNKGSYGIASYDDAPLLANIPTDVYTGAAFAYSSTDSDYSLVYNITLPTYVAGTSARGIYMTDYSDSYTTRKLKMSVVNGKNTANSKNTSQEAVTQSQKDTDGDGMPDVLEAYLGTSPTKKDSDGDGRSDTDELMSGSNPLGPGNLKGGSSSYYY
jgi:hypothetical protein